jgi:hypothetical protein
MCVSQSRPAGKYLERPAPCRVCGSPAWWNGVRHVAEVIRDALGAIVHVADVVRRRVRCSNRACSGGSWTLYAPGSYPHRVFQLPVVASAVGEVTLGDAATVTSAACHHLCSRRSVRRWVRWIADLVDPTVLARACARLDPAGLAGGAIRAGAEAARAAGILRGFERLAGLLEVRGVSLPEVGPGLSRVLTDQLARFGVVAYLTKSSPPLRVSWDRWPL